MTKKNKSYFLKVVAQGLLDQRYLQENDIDKRNERVQATAAGSKDLADERLQITVTIAIWQGFESFLLQNHRSLFTVCQRAIQ